MGEFIDKRQFRAPGKKGIEIHFVEHPPLILNGHARDNLKARKQRFCFGPAMGLDNASHNIVSTGESCPPRQQHFVGFADTWSGAKEDLQAATPGLLAAGKLKQRFG
jgi:hypothetical protein